MPVRQQSQIECLLRVPIVHHPDLDEPQEAVGRGHHLRGLRLKHQLVEYRDLDVDNPVGHEVGRGPTACEQCDRIGARGYLVGHDDGRCEIELV